MFKLFDFSSLQTSRTECSLEIPLFPPLIPILDLSFLYSTHSCSQFQDAILFRDSILLDGIFKAFDLDSDGLIDFNEYISCLSTVSSKAPADDKLKREHFKNTSILYLLETVLTRPHSLIFIMSLVLLSLSLSLYHLVSFKIYDLDGDGVISTKDLTKVVADTMREQDVVIHKGTDSVPCCLQHNTESELILNKCGIMQKSNDHKRKTNMNMKIIVHIDININVDMDMNMNMNMNKNMNMNVNMNMNMSSGCRANSGTNDEGSQP